MPITAISDEYAMSATVLLTTILIAAALLAIWVDMRLGERSPHSLTTVMLHIIVAFAVLNAVGVFGPMAIGPSRIATLLALMMIVLPGFIYAFLASLWALKLARDAMPR